MKRAIIIFVRNPVLGKVKTRLAKTIGACKALEVYKQLLLCTRAATASLNCDKYIFYADNISNDDIWGGKTFYKRLQEGNDLGERMKLAFKTLFEMGYHKVLIIGSDCPELSAAIVESAFNSLDKVNVVIGPAGDGGYYLLGMDMLYSFLFENKQWSTSHVLEETLNDLNHHKATYKLLPVLHDIDEEIDLKYLK